MAANQMEGLHKPSGSVDHSQSIPDLRARRAAPSEDNDSDQLLSRADLFDEPGSSDGVSIHSVLSAYSDEFHGSQQLRDVDAEIRLKLSQLTKTIAEGIRDRDDEIAYGVSISERQMHSFRVVAEDRNGQLQALAENLTDLEKERMGLLNAIGYKVKNKPASTTNSDELIEVHRGSSNEGSPVRRKNRLQTTRKANPPPDTSGLPKQLSPLDRMTNSAIILAAGVVSLQAIVLATARAPGLDLGAVLAVTSAMMLGVDVFTGRASLRHVLALMVFAQFQAIDMGIRLIAERPAN